MITKDTTNQEIRDLAATAASQFMRIYAAGDRFLAATNKIARDHLGLTSGRIPLLRECREAWNDYQNVANQELAGDWWDDVNETWDHVEQRIYLLMVEAMTDARSIEQTIARVRSVGIEVV